MASINVLPKKLCFVNSGHISDSCNEVEKRINCGDGSISISWECSKILEEIETIIIKTDRGVSFPEAKKIFFLHSSSLLPYQGVVMQQLLLQVLLKLLVLVRVGFWIIVFDSCR